MRIIVGVALLLFSLNVRANQGPVGPARIEADHVRVSLLGPVLAQDGKTYVGVHFQPENEWHLYWKNSGDSGAPPKFSFSSSRLQFSAPLWPAPIRLPFAGLVNLGYPGEVVFPVPVSNLDRENQGSWAADLEWLVCSKDECVPGFAQLEKTWTGAAATSSETKLIEQFLAQVPREFLQSPWSVSRLAPTSEGLLLELHGPVQTRESLEIFPVDGERWVATAPEKELIPEGVRFRLKAQAGASRPSRFDFVLTSPEGAWEAERISFSPVGHRAAGSEPLLWLFLLAFLGGLILNVMPCVLPVLSIKLFSLIQTEGGVRARGKEAGLYTLGVVTSFLGLGALFLALRAAGQEVGWGFQLQSPAIILALACLFWVLALNFWGLFEIGEGLMNWAGKSKKTSSFFTGVLAVFVAAPCTGPFMGTALGAAAVLSPMAALLIFAALGLGLASPFLAVALIPGLAKRLPRPGAWMLKLRQFFAFPLVGTVIWLLWVLESQSGSSTVFFSLILLLWLSFCLWLGFGKNTKVKLLAWLLALTGFAIALAHVSETKSDSKSAMSARWQEFKPEKITEIRRQKKALFIDFTASWCLTCQVNKKVVLDTDRAQALFARHQVELIRADWSRRDEEIARALAAYGRNSVPLYVFYPAGEDSAKILPQILSFGDIEELFQQPQQGEQK